ncbi:hypothetical protein HMN09_01371700 [Mycena chlorophos]|uniref:Polysaccharide lyase 14 domain-containing protein n=1 Tax=Mycena chlorophos TaxID=658473 RepID=A0A8H6RXE4_MYCCL|nr:hypothetical protein HMN09_01371700 [Mycena chlorophos]
MFCAVYALLSVSFIAVAADTPASIASSYALSTSTSLPFPSATEASTDTQTLLSTEWGLSKGRIQNGGPDLEFVSDPFPNSPAPGTTPNTSAPVTYPAGSFSGNTGGSQFYNLWNTSNLSGFGSMLLSYEVAFDAGFDWVKGGKLPGLRGGGPDGCSGGDASDGSSCFSARIMWRPNGAGEAYTYTPLPDSFCSDNDVICNSDGFGTSLDRGSFTFESGKWNHITLLVQMNNPVDVAKLSHYFRFFLGCSQRLPAATLKYSALRRLVCGPRSGVISFNDVQALQQPDMQIRTTTNLSINGMYFSTFFGGSDSSWATPNTTHTYFRNIQLWAGSNPSNLTGSVVSSAVAVPRWHPTSTALFVALLVGLSSVL